MACRLPPEGFDRRRLLRPNGIRRDETSWRRRAGVGGPCDDRCLAADARRPGPFDEGGLPLREVDEGPAQAHDEVPELQIAALRLEPGDLARHHERLDLALQAVA